MKRLALIGYGYWGPNILRNLFDIPKAQVVYLVDLSNDRLNLAKKRYPSIKTTTDINLVLNDPKVDGVIIATPTKTHFSLGQKFLNLGKNILIEKPMTQNLEEAMSLVKLSKKKKKLLMVDHTFLFNDAVIKIKELIDKGELGNILYIDSVRANLGLFQTDVNVIYDLASHDFSIIQYLLESKPKSIRATGASHYSKQEDVAYISAKYPNNIMAHVHVSWLSPLKIRKMMIIGTKKMIVYDDTETAEKIRVYDKGIIMDIDNALAQQLKIGYRSGDAWLPKINIIEPLSLMLEEFVKGMDKKKGEVKSSGLFALGVMESLDSATKSIRIGRKVNL